VVQAADDGGLPFAAGAFDLVVSRHPVETVWPEVARVLRPGGHYFSQQIGPGSNRELTDFMMGPQPVSLARDPGRAVAEAEAAGMIVTDVREQALRTVFYDVGAVVYFLRKVLWTVPGFTVGAYLEPLRRMHDQIQADGPFVSHAQRFLIEARKPWPSQPETTPPPPGFVGSAWAQGGIDDLHRGQVDHQAGAQRRMAQPGG
jgi:SAM-dependent methyltransferase